MSFNFLKKSDISFAILTTSAREYVSCDDGVSINIKLLETLFSAFAAIFFLYREHFGFNPFHFNIFIFISIL